MIIDDLGVRGQARVKIGEVLAQEQSRVNDDILLSTLVNSSFVLVELIIELQEEFDVRFHQADLDNIATVGQLLDLIESRLSRADSN